jgi:hypothetical protein
MAGTPEVLQDEPQVQERREEFIVDETLSRAGAQVVQKTFKAQVKDDKGTPLIQTPPARVITVSPPGDQQTLIKQSKGSVSSSLTWLAAFWLRVIKKALHFGWSVVGGQK